tara:strand:+ start:53973 stop:54185 length:213 start_codon:yes stop_codon:yes gene_type:complete
MSKTTTKPETTNDTLSQWPPQAHIFKSHGPKASEPKEGDLALCGAKLMGMDLKSAQVVCKKCMAIAKGGK